MNIISWNVNGLRALYKKGHWDWFLLQSPDIFCIQETKSSPDQLPEEVRSPKGYFSYFNSSQGRKGYSGVAVYSKKEPIKVSFDLWGDTEGRIICAEYKDFYLLNIYFPNGGGGPERLAYKLKFYDSFLAYIEKLKKKKPVVFCGDINTAHTEIDLARPKENVTNTGFLPIERSWIDKVVGKGYVDIFRSKNPELRDAYTYWDQKTFARERNVGWRIDYFFVSQDLVGSIDSVAIHGDIFGSDHCPISIVLKDIE
jgi:exodeoxyribonuclease-3